VRAAWRRQVSLHLVMGPLHRLCDGRMKINKYDELILPHERLKRTHGPKLKHQKRTVIAAKLPKTYVT
jgi:hypothetical protein